MAVQPAVVPFADIENQLRPFHDLETRLLDTYRQNERDRRLREQNQFRSTPPNPASTSGAFKKIKTWLCGDAEADEDGCFKKARNLLTRQRASTTVGDEDDEDDKDEEDDGGVCFKEIRNLLYIESSPVHKKALEEWQRKEKLFTSRVERKTKKVGNLKNEVYQMLGFFSVFQGVVLTAVAQSNLLHCNNKWSPIVLSVLASVLTIAAVTQKLSQVSSLQKTINSEERSLKIAITSRIMVLKIKLKNESGVKVKVKEGNAGIMRLLTTLDPNKSFEISHDPNATYREYMLMLLPDRSSLRLLSSDDFNDWKRIKIYRHGNVCDWMGTVPRDPKRQRIHPPPASTPPLAPPVALGAHGAGANAFNIAGPAVGAHGVGANGVAGGAFGVNGVAGGAFGVNGVAGGAFGVNGVAGGGNCANATPQTSNGGRSKWRLF